MSSLSKNNYFLIKLGVSIRTLLVRDDKVVNNLFDDPNYDFNYQNAMDVEPTKIKKVFIKK